MNEIDLDMTYQMIQSDGSDNLVFTSHLPIVDMEPLEGECVGVPVENPHAAGLERVEADSLGLPGHGGRVEPSGLVAAMHLLDGADVLCHVDVKVVAAVRPQTHLGRRPEVQEAGASPHVAEDPQLLKL